MKEFNKQDKWLKNLTDKTLPKPVENILGLGQKFNLKVSNENTPTAKIIAGLEPMIHKLPQTAERIELRNKLCNILTNHKKARTRKSTLDVVINEQFNITKEFITNNPDVIVLNADKGNVTVLLPKEQYVTKMGELLKDHKIKDTIIPDGYVLVSLDVVSLFTNIPSELVYKAIDKRWFQIKKFTTLPKKEFLEGLKVVLENCTFSFNDIIYHQIFGSPMGSPVSPVVADLVMEMVEDEAFNKYKSRTPFYYRYVDDSCTSCPENKMEELLNTFNSINQHIQFTMEIESSNQIAFLDTLVIRDNTGKITTNWYHKATWSGRYLNFHSSLPFSYKKNTIAILTERMLKLASPTYHRENCELIKQTLLKNNYPAKLLENVIDKVILNFDKPKDKKDKSDKKYVSIPYVDGLFEKIKSLFKQYDIQVVGKGDHTLQQKLFTKLKDAIPVQLQSGLIYKVVCTCGKVYIGQTIQRLQKRLEGHRYNCKIGNKQHSALCEHLIETQHQLNWDDVKILCKEPKKRNRDVMEMIAIKTTANVINKQQECKFLSNTYNNVIKDTFKC
ncbi:uncharacterized protein LOC119068513 [Bradysia coprophila]|uniref:uncharacterized protein LOC119068513 n=1 Tax=Bradysia coprophila TaxID=38358 RepID=UPI00187DB418|nr:uncharacterized protein LOC119068513 [Bradysia coprophila]